MSRERLRGQMSPIRLMGYARGKEEGRIPGQDVERCADLVGAVKEQRGVRRHGVFFRGSWPSKGVLFSSLNLGRAS